MSRHIPSCALVTVAPLLVTAFLCVPPSCLAAEAAPRHEDQPGPKSTTAPLVTKVEIYKPGATGWADADKLPWEGVIFRSEKLKFKITLSKAITALTDVTWDVKIRSFNDTTAAEDWKAVTLDAQNSQIAGGGTEVRVTLAGSEVINKGLLPTNAADSDDEFTTADDASGTGSNHNDSNSFDTTKAAAGAKRRGKARDNGNRTKNPPESKVNADFVKAAGVVYVEAKVNGKKAEFRQLQNQADIFYASGHGWHLSGKILNGAVDPTDVTAHWNKDLEIIVFAGCSVFDINDYSDNFTGAQHTASPGEKWAPQGPKWFLGYNWKAPLDDNLGDPNFTKDIVDAYLAATGAQYTRWLNANKNKATTTNRSSPGQRPWNSCVIDMDGTIKGYWYFDYHNIVGGEPALTFTHQNQW